MANIRSRARERFGAFLKAVRLDAGVSPAAAADVIKVTVSTLNRYELGSVRVDWATAGLLLTFYGASKNRVAEAERLFEQVKDEPRSVRLPTDTPKAFRKLVNVEREAVRERELAPYVMPGLLQHKRYAQALLPSEDRLKLAEANPGKVLNARMNRQAVLDGPEPLSLHAVIDESVFHRQIGGVDVLREQLAHLLVVTARPNITVQVIQYAEGCYGTMNGAFIIVDYPEPGATPGVYLEYPAGGDWVDNEDDVRRFTTMFDEITQRALTPADTTDLIHQTLRALST